MKFDAATLREWRHNPVKFAYDNFRFDPDPWQREALEAFVDPSKPRVSLQACAGPGKSAILAVCGWHFLATQGDRGHHPKSYALSITADNLKDNLWAEMSKWQGRSEWLMSTFKWNHERIYALEHPSTWFMSARSFPKSASAEEIGLALSGLHSEFILYLLDETGGIPPQILKSAEQGLSTNPKFAKILMAGNPTSQSGALYDASVTNRHKWFVITITGDPDDPRRSTRIDIEWAREQIQTYGRDNPWVKAFILGVFPEGSINTLIGADLVEAAIKRVLRPNDFNFSQKRIGVDVARFGDDRTCLFPRQGLQAFNPVIMRDARSNEIAARVALAKARWGSEMEFVDGTGGYGSGVIDSLRMAGHAPMEVQFSGKAIVPKYYNKRSEMWFEMADWIKRGGGLPNLPGLVRELSTPTYYFKDGKFLLEPKELIKKRLGQSPDMADALCLTFAMPDMPASIDPNGLVDLSRGKLKSEYDPLDQKSGGMVSEYKIGSF